MIECLATDAELGPRFLHSTGQLHKGGPGSGLFLQLTTEHTQDVAIPHAPYTLACWLTRRPWETCRYFGLPNAGLCGSTLGPTCQQGYSRWPERWHRGYVSPETSLTLALETRE